MTGAILEIYNSGEVIVARYVYDAFGNHKVYDGSYNANTNDSFIGTSIHLDIRVTIMTKKVIFTI